MKALLATDGTPEVVEATRHALHLLHPDMEVDVVTVIPEIKDPNDMAGGFEGPLMTEEEAEREHELDEQHGKEMLRSVSEFVHDSGTSELIEGDDPGRALCRYAEERNIDLLIVGGSEKNWFRRLVQGSVMEYVVHHAPCPVLVMRHPSDT